MQTTTRRGVLAASAALAAAMPGTARAQARWQAATAYPDGNFQTRNMRTFVDAVQACNVVVFHHGTGKYLGRSAEKELQNFGGEGITLPPKR